MPRSIDAHREDCPCPACRKRRGIAVRHGKMSLRLPDEVRGWLHARPEGAQAWVTAAVRAAMEAERP